MFLVANLSIARGEEGKSLNEADAAVTVVQVDNMVREIAQTKEPREVTRKAEAALETLLPVLELGDKAGETAWTNAALIAIALDDGWIGWRSSEAIKRLVPEYYKDPWYLKLMARLKSLNEAWIGGWELRNGIPPGAYDFGIVVALDKEQAVHRYRRLAEKGHPGAAAVLGLLAENGKYGLRKNRQDSAKWFSRAIAAHDEGCLVGAAVRGFVNQDYSAAFEKSASQIWDLLQLGALVNNRGLVQALGNSYVHSSTWPALYLDFDRYDSYKGESLCFEVGFTLMICRENRAKLPVKPDIGRAVWWWEKAAQLGSHTSMLLLGKVLSGLESRHSEASIGWWRKAADANNAWAMYELGTRSEISDSEKSRWLGSAVIMARFSSFEAGCRSAIELLSYYKAGRTGKRDYEHALTFLRQAAEAGEIPSSEIDRLEESAEIDPFTAERWRTLYKSWSRFDPFFYRDIISRSENDLDYRNMAHALMEQANLGDAHAILGMAAISRSDIGKKFSPEETLDWLRKAAEAEHNAAYSGLALHYIQKDPFSAESRKWLQKSAEAGRKDAKLVLEVLERRERSQE